MRSMGSHQSAAAKSHVWLTPPQILAALGEFDLDPAAAPEPRPWATAAVHWTAADKPLETPWFGRVWLNPPFGPRKLLDAFMARMAAHDCGIALLAARTETATFHRYVWQPALGVLFLRGRPHFHHANGARAAANSGAPIALVSYGPGDTRRLRTCGLPGKFMALDPAAPIRSPLNEWLIQDFNARPAA
jgi:hypothetical protein